MKLEFNVPNLACRACVETITNAVKAIDPNAKVEADPKTKQVVIETAASESSMREAIGQVGYTALS